MMNAKKDTIDASVVLSFMIGAVKMIDLKKEGG